MKNILNFLRKIGLLQMSKGDYNSGEFDSRRDLKEKPSKKSPSGKKGGRMRPILFWIAVVLAIFFLLAALSAGFMWFIIIAVSWGFLLLFLKKWAFVGMYTKKLGIIMFLVVFIFTFIVIPTDNQTSSGVSSNVCQGTKLSKKADERITAKIVVAGDTQNTVIKETYNVSEFADLAYGYNARETDEGYYVAYELCKGSERLSDLGGIDVADPLFKQDKGGTGNMSSGQYSDFASTVNDVPTNDITEPGMYTVYAFVSYNGKKWYIADEHTFEVK